MHLSSPALADQCRDQTVKGGEAKEESGEGNVGVGQSFHLLVVEHPTRRRDLGEVKVLRAAFSYVAARSVTLFWNGPNEVEVSPGVKERGGEAKDEDLEEPAHLPLLPPISDLSPQLFHFSDALTFALVLKKY